MVLELPCKDVERTALATALAEMPLIAGWLGSVGTAVKQPRSTAFRAAHAAAARRLGSHGRASIADLASGPCLRPHWSLLDAARWLLVQRALEGLGKAEWPGFVDGLFRAGELGEQVSLLRTLWALPAPEGYASTAVEACRTNVVSVFEAIACENPYPASHFDALAFNQMVVKAIFLDVSVRRIEGLEQRNGPDLVRMALGLASERRAAGRPVPNDIDFIVEQGHP